MEFQRASFQSVVADAQFFYGLACLGKAIGQIGAAIGESASRSKLDELMKKLGSTPMSIEKPVFAPDQFNRAEIDAAKEVSVNYYMYDRRSYRYVKRSFDVRQTDKFTVAYKLHADDKSLSSHLSAMNVEGDVVKFGGAPIQIRLSKNFERSAR